MRLKGTGRLGIGTTAPDKQLEINDTDGNCLRLTHNDSDGKATNYADFSVSSGGDLTITPSGGDIWLISKVGIGTTGPQKKLEVNDMNGNCLRLCYNDFDGKGTDYADFTMSSTGDLTIAPIGGDTNITGTLSISAQPSFYARRSTTIPNVTGDSTTYTIIFDTIEHNEGSHYNTTNGIFTVPKTGIYSLHANVNLVGLLSGHTGGNLIISGKSAPPMTYFNPWAIRSVFDGPANCQLSCVRKLTVGDTMSVTVQVSGSTPVVDVATDSYFSAHFLG
jgi:hypothetical protein